jgi:accessory colonization factor AcfC
MGQFDTNSIIFRNVEIFKKNKNKIKCQRFIFFLKGNKEFDEIFQNISFVEMEFSKLINYSTNMC